jgi:hypothetical protein
LSGIFTQRLHSCTKKKKENGQELAMMGKKGVCERSQRRFLALSSFNAWNGFENTVAAFSLFPHVGIIVYRHERACIYERCTAYWLLVILGTAT